MIHRIIAAKLQKYIDAEDANRLSRMVIHNVAILAIGQGLIGDTLNASLGAQKDRLSGVEWLRDYWRQQIAAALAN